LSVNSQCQQTVNVNIFYLYPGGRGQLTEDFIMHHVMCLILPPIYTDHLFFYYP